MKPYYTHLSTKNEAHCVMVSVWAVSRRAELTERTETVRRAAPVSARTHIITVTVCVCARSCARETKGATVAHEQAWEGALTNERVNTIL